ncbi:MAG: energy-coupling factor ABC transporter permease [Eubacteriales bacterium]|nr:energy-coupling factor ABC transporter permease [Eubacteriales bacterium]
MHMADALISPLVGGTMLAATVGIASFSVKKLQNELDDKKVPLMGVMGAFIFATQMINFTIPVTGSSGHLGGGLLLAILLGPYAGFLTMASVLLIQALFFGDGGLLAYGANVFNLGFYTSFIVYPLIYRSMTRKGLTTKRIFFASLTAAIMGLQLGALSVVFETLFSGKTELPFIPFLLLMQPIHLAIGVVEGLVTSAVVTYVWKVQPDIVLRPMSAPIIDVHKFKKLLIAILIVTTILAVGLSWFASTDPDGLEWAIEKTTGSSGLSIANRLHLMLATVQEKTTFLPDYSFKSAPDELNRVSEESWPAVNLGTSVSGLVGGALTLALVIITGVVISWLKRRKRSVK